MKHPLQLAPDLTGRTALVTGSTSGIGRGIAEVLAAAGANVMLHGLEPPDVREAVRSELAALGAGRVAVHDADLNRPDAIERLIEDTEVSLGPVDILVNNAGLQHVAPVHEFPVDRWELIQRVVLQSSFLAIRRVVPAMRQRNWGRIITIVSAHGLVASRFKSAYVAAKHGQVGLTRTVALELAETPITTNAICPGYVRTPLVERQIEAQAQAHGLPREAVIRDVILAAQPNRRFVEVEEIAAMVLFLCGPYANSINGAALAIDGGWTAC